MQSKIQNIINLYNKQCTAAIISSTSTEKPMKRKIKMMYKMTVIVLLVALHPTPEGVVAEGEDVVGGVPVVARGAII